MGEWKAQEHAAARNGSALKTSPEGAPILTGQALQKIKEQVEKEFAKVRTVERRRYANSSKVNPALYGRRKDDIKEPRPRPQLSHVAKPILEDAVKAAPLVYHRRPDVAVHDLGDVSVIEDAPKLFDAALAALGYQPEKPPDEPSVSAEPKKSVWHRDIFRKET
jgi:hypothetical protein